MRGFLAFLIVGIVALAAIVGISIVRGTPITLMPQRQGNVVVLPPSSNSTPLLMPTPGVTQPVPAEDQPLIPGEIPETNSDVTTVPPETIAEPGLSDSSNQGRIVDTPTVTAPVDSSKSTASDLDRDDTVASANTPGTKAPVRSDNKAEPRADVQAESKPAVKVDAAKGVKTSTGTAGAPTAAKPAPSTKHILSNGKLMLTEEVYKNGYHKGEPVVVVVDPSSHFTYIFQKQDNNKIALVYRASNATGDELTQTPYGRFHITQKTKWPAWVPPKSVDPEQKAVHPYNKDRKNPLGVARIRLNKWDIALHGTNNQASIRQDASKGCIRHSNKDIEKIFAMVEKGDRVIVTKKLVGTTVTAKDFKGGPA